jgi:citronellol/citronellal dehydrogenase
MLANDIKGCLPRPYITGFCVRVDGGTPNAHNTWKLEPHGRSAPFEGFHRSTLPDLLKKKPDLQS